MRRRETIKSRFAWAKKTKGQRMKEFYQQRKKFDSAKEYTWKHTSNKSICNSTNHNVSPSISTSFFTKKLELEAFVPKIPNKNSVIFGSLTRKCQLRIALQQKPRRKSNDLSEKWSSGYPGIF